MIESLHYHRLVYSIANYSIDVKKSLKASDEAKYPEKQGLWKRIYPYDTYSQSQTSSVKIGDVAMKNIVKNIKSCMI